MLWRWEAGELRCRDSPGHLQPRRSPCKVRAHGIPFHHLPVTKGAKAEQEAQVEALLKEHEVDVVVLARYMQILSPEFLGFLQAADHQHPPLVPARLRRSKPVPSRPTPAG